MSTKSILTNQESWPLGGGWVGWPRQGPRLTLGSQTGERTPKKVVFQLSGSVSQVKKIATVKSSTELDSAMYGAPILPSWKKIHSHTWSLCPCDSLPPVSPIFLKSDFLNFATCISRDHISHIFWFVNWHFLSRIAQYNLSLTLFYTFSMFFSSLLAAILPFFTVIFTFAHYGVTKWL